MCEGYQSDARSIFTVEFRSSDCSENYNLKSAIKAAYWVKLLKKDARKKKCHYSYKTFAEDYVENMENKNTLMLKENQVLKLVIKCFRLLFSRQVWNFHLLKTANLNAMFTRSSCNIAVYTNLINGGLFFYLYASKKWLRDVQWVWPATGINISEPRRYIAWYLST